MLTIAKLERDLRLDNKVVLGTAGWGNMGKTTAQRLRKPTDETTESDIDKILGIRFKGPFFFLQAMLSTLANGRSIIQISSATATIVLENRAACMGAKAAIDHVIRVVANEYGARGIRANSISPGMTFQIPDMVGSFTPEHRLGRVGTREDIAATVVWLGSDECFMTVQAPQVNGRLSLRCNPNLKELGGVAARATAHRA